MDSVEPGQPSADVLSLWRRHWPSRTGGPGTPRREGGGGAPGRPAAGAAKEGPAFRDLTDKDLDALLARSGVAPGPRHRDLARFFLRHRLELRPEFFRLADGLFPKGARSVAAEDAFLAALAKLPPSEVGEGFATVLSALDGGHPTVMACLARLRIILTDLVSATFAVDDVILPPDLLRGALEEQILMLECLLGLPAKDQVRLLAGRSQLLAQLCGLLRLFDNLAAVLSRLLGAEGGKPLLDLLAQARAAARQGADILLTDAILSREDVHRQLAETGAAHALAVALGGPPLPCRLWVHDRDNPASLELDPEGIVLFFRWHTGETGLLEATAEIDGEDLDLVFAAPDASLRARLEAGRERIEERLGALGYRAGQKPSLGRLRSAHPEHEVEAKETRPASHLDLEA